MSKNYANTIRYWVSIKCKKGRPYANLHKAFLLNINCSITNSLIAT